LTNSGATGTLDVDPDATEDGGATSAAGDSPAAPLGRSSVGRVARSGAGSSSTAVVVGDSEVEVDVVDDAVLGVALDAAEPPSSLEQAATAQSARAVARARR
jgi:hypothetical protein